jgi:hypothetical protein
MITAIPSYLDVALFDAVQQRRRRGGIAVAGVVSALAEPQVAYPMLLAVGIRAARPTGRRAVAAQPVVVATGAAMRRAVSRWIARPRPAPPGSPSPRGTACRPSTPLWPRSPWAPASAAWT